jgi:hypothetical protein
MVKMPMPISFAEIHPWVGSQFTVLTSAQPVQLTLVTAEERERRGLPEQFRTPMSLLFSGPATPQLAQDNYQFEHPVLGQHVWMLVPVMALSLPPQTGATGQDAKAYEVTFG